jgi:hypothetical protein
MALIEVAKSPNDHRVYRFLVLENGLKVLLVHDPEIARAKDSAGGEVSSALARYTGRELGKWWLPGCWAYITADGKPNYTHLQ